MVVFVKLAPPNPNMMSDTWNRSKDCKKMHSYFRSSKFGRSMLKRVIFTPCSLDFRMKVFTVSNEIIMGLSVYKRGCSNNITLNNNFSTITYKITTSVKKIQISH
jgi:hypothetical protein